MKLTNVERIQKKLGELQIRRGECRMELRWAIEEFMKRPGTSGLPPNWGEIERCRDSLVRLEYAISLLEEVC